MAAGGPARGAHGAAGGCEVTEPRRARRSRRARRAFCLVLVVLSAAVIVPLLAQQAPDRSRPPQLGPPPPLKLPPVQKRVLSNGIPVWLIETHEVPIVQDN